MRFISKRERKLEAALQYIVQTANELCGGREPDVEDYDDMESASSRGIDAGWWDAGRVAKKALRSRKSVGAGPPEIWVGQIDHKHGTNLYLSESEQGLRRQIAAYCAEWWDPDQDGPMPRGFQKRIDEYFEGTQTEFLEYFGTINLQ